MVWHTIFALYFLFEIWKTQIWESLHNLQFFKLLVIDFWGMTLVNIQFIQFYLNLFLNYTSIISSPLTKHLKNPQKCVFKFYHISWFNNLCVNSPIFSHIFFIFPSVWKFCKSLLNEKFKKKQLCKQQVYNDDLFTTSGEFWKKTLIKMCWKKYE